MNIEMLCNSSSAMKRTNSKYLFCLLLVFILQNTLFAFDDTRQSAEPSFDVKLLVAICAAAGTLTTAVVNLIRWIRERSTGARKIEALSYALRLKDFINAEMELSSAIYPGLESQNAAAQARSELHVLLSKIGGEPRSMPKYRRALLLYPPKGWRAWIAHSLFFAVCIFFGTAIKAAVANELGEFKAQEIAMLFAVIVLSGTFFHSWAALEYRIYNSIQLQPKALGHLFWYPANNRYGLLAQITLVLGFVRLISFLLVFLPETILTTTIPFSPWEVAFATLVRSALLPVGYFWCQAEFDRVEQEQHSPSKNTFKKLWKTHTGEQVAALLILLLLTVWNVILIVGLKAMPMLASMPDSDGVPIGLGAALFSYAVSVALVAWLPWIAVWRGLPLLYPNDQDQSQLNLFTRGTYGA
jgi:hypothetical protein